MQERLDRLAKQIQSSKLASTATVEDRYRKNISCKPIPQTAIAMVEAGSAGLTGGGAKPADKPAAKEEPAKEEPKKEEPKKKGFGLGRLLPTGGDEQKSTQANASGGTRGVDPETNAKGGPNPKLVPVKLVVADYFAFKKEGGLK
jgi:hypothetical protein